MNEPVRVPVFTMALFTMALFAVAGIVGAVGLGAGRAAAEDASSELIVFERATSRLLKDWTVLRQRRSKDVHAIEQGRKKARALARASAGSDDASRWRATWAAVAKKRAALHQQHAQPMLPWSKALLALLARQPSAPLAQAARRKVGVHCFAVVRSWLLTCEPARVRADLTAASAIALAWFDAASERRALLAAIADRHVATPGFSDVDVLCEVVAWDAIFLERLGAGAPQLDALSSDLIQICTERAADGVSKSGSRLYRATRFSDRGFRPALRDGSDQVRHFAWAFRMFAKSERRDGVEALLAFKERMDATRRKQPLNKADLALNKAARRLVETILDVPTGTRPAETERIPIPAARHAGLFRRVLGERAATSARSK